MYGDLPPLPDLPFELKRQAFAHKSSLGSYPKRLHDYESLSYKPLEFFGDAVVEYQVSRILRTHFRTVGPGVLTAIRHDLLRNNTLAYLGWGLGFAPRIRYHVNSPLAVDDGANAAQLTLAEVFEAYVGACAEVASLRPVLDTWFDTVFSPQGTVFPTLAHEFRVRDERLRAKRERIVQKIAKKGTGFLSASRADLGCALTGRSISAIVAEADDDKEGPQNKRQKVEYGTLDYSCIDRASALQGFTWHEDEHGAAKHTAGRLWHSNLHYNGQWISCGSGQKRLAARDEAWASFIRAVLVDRAGPTSKHEGSEARSHQA
ncbi:hypothetical protein JCM10908_001251 [Rhodotorula pacifica]|uniref:ribonuclease III domain-containing protein n=1 Tax=Rhodotorula pacifica TaxID=1495444 RepID=UPI003179FB22